MRVVRYSEAAKLAGVSRQAISCLKKSNAEDKTIYSFFCYHPTEGFHGIDIDNPEWIDYLGKDDPRRVKENRLKKDTKRQDNTSNEANLTAFNNLIDAVEVSVKEMFDLTEDESDQLKAAILSNYRRISEENSV